MIRFFKSLFGTNISQKQLRYLPQSIRLEEAVNPHLIRLTMTLISVTILAFITWASFTNIREVAHTTGEIVPEGFVQVVQHLHGGIISKINVTEGELVEEGQLLLHIDDGTARHDLAQVKARHHSLQIKAIRLRSFLENIEPDFKTIEDTDATTEEIRIANMELQHARQNVIGLNNALKIKESNLNLAEKNLKSSEDIHAKGYLSEMDLREARRKLNEARNDIVESKSSLDKSIREAYRELAETEDKIAQDIDIITKLTKRVQRLAVISPVRGLVKGLEINTIGSIIKAGQTLMEIVPLDKPLISRVKISPKDIGHIQLGQTVRLKIGAYDFTRYGSIEGKVKFVSATTFTEKDGQLYYRGRVQLLNNYVGKNKNSNIVMPGMTVQADILTGEKSILAYLLKPIRNSLQTAFTER